MPVSAPIKTRRHQAAQRGLSLVELLVGIAVGMFVLAGATMLLSTQLGDNRRLLLETQLQQDMRASMDIMARDLRRAGAHLTNSVNFVWAESGATASPSNKAAVTVSEAGDEIQFGYWRGAIDGVYGFRWADGRIRTQVGAGNWQELTDPNVMRVTDFEVVEEPPEVEVVPCARACSADPTDQSCWPTVAVRAYTITMVAQSVNDPTVRRSQTSRVRLPNDMISFNNPAAPSQLCPP